MANVCFEPARNFMFIVNQNHYFKVATFHN